MQALGITEAEDVSVAMSADAEFVVITLRGDSSTVIDENRIQAWSKQKGSSFGVGMMSPDSSASAGSDSTTPPSAAVKANDTAAVVAGVLVAVVMVGTLVGIVVYLNGKKKSRTAAIASGSYLDSDNSAMEVGLAYSDPTSGEEEMMSGDVQQV
jgi:hypothetical protein